MCLHGLHWVCCGSVQQLTSSLALPPSQYVRRFMRPAELSSLVSSCGYLGARPNDTTMASLLRDLQNMYTDATGDDLANFAMAMAQFQYKPA